MVEKPKPEDAPTNLAIIGRYILTPDIFDIIRDTRQERMARFKSPMRCYSRQKRLCYGV